MGHKIEIKVVVRLPRTDEGRPRVAEDGKDLAYLSLLARYTVESILLSDSDSQPSYGDELPAIAKLRADEVRT